ncbi:MAG: single-stranded DNA-binding protein [Acidobacteriota bacterium]|nr:single-stranded DNA-binding protein [Blastocatellia bacterium]MDW8411913.1 single-stranded DNA-binding protein [Acidobacteriota bacterium]
MSFNKIIIVGHLGRDPELRYTPQGKPVCDFSVATTDRRRDQNGETKEETTWFRVTFWDRQAEIASQYLAKGRQVYIEGRLRAREWTDREGRVRVTLEVTGTELHMLGGAPKADEVPKVEETSKTPHPADEPITDDDIPF